LEDSWIKLGAGCEDNADKSKNEIALSGISSALISGAEYD
jgi:hypothetical protein